MQNAGMGIIRKIFGDSKISRRPSRTHILTVPRAELPTGERTHKFTPFSYEDVEDFLNGTMVQVLSSNVDKAQYDSEKETLFIWYLDGALWAYDPYTIQEAAGFIRAPSKGGWCWDYIRVKGVGNEHKHQRNARRVA